MIAIPSPYDILNFAVRAEDRPRIDFAYTEALLREVDRIAANLPHDQIALQWDIAHAFEYLATNDDKTFFPITRDQLVALLVQLGERVPSTVQLGYHCCYGNAFLKHFVEPTDTGEMVAVMNGVLAALERSVSFIHMPVPMDRADDAYFAPLKLLNAVPEMDIFLGLVHDRDGVEGAMKRARAARKAMPRFGIGTECGLQQRSQENAKELLQLQDRVAAAIEREPA
jgi:methionine synthase II (cobalamin-independent)